MSFGRPRNASRIASQSRKNEAQNHCIVITHSRPIFDTNLKLKSNEIEMDIGVKDSIIYKRMHVHFHCKKSYVFEDFIVLIWYFSDRNLKKMIENEDDKRLKYIFKF